MDSDSNNEGRIKRAVTAPGIPALNKRDQHHLKADMVKVPTKKIARCKSSSCIPGLNYVESPQNNNSSFESDNDTSSPCYETDYKNLNSAKTDSIFNETLILTGSPTQGFRHPTVIRRSKGNPRSPESFSTLDSDQFQVNDQFRIQAISPLSEETANTDSSTKPVSEKLDELLDKIYSSVTEDESPATANNKEINQTKNSPSKTLLSPKSGNSILEPLRGNQIGKSNSVFKEHSAMGPSSTAHEQYDNPYLKETTLEDLENEGKRGDSSICSDRQKVPLFRNKTGILKRGWIFILILTGLLITAICGYIPTVLLLSRGSRGQTFKYFSSLNPSSKFELYKSVGSRFNLFDYNHLADEDASQNILGFNRSSNQKLFNGISYSPLNSMEPLCGSTPEDIKLDIKELSQITEKIRNYGMQCNQSKYILDAIQGLNLDMSLTMGVWIGDNDTINDQQINSMKHVLTQYPRKLFHSVIIGNEVLFREDKSELELIDIIKEVKKFTKKIGYFDLPVGTSEIGSLISETLLESCDIIGANIHPFFGGVDVSMATNWTYEFLKYQIEPLNQNAKTKIIVTEVGWPYGGGRYKGSVANPTNFQYFLNSWICESQMSNYEWYYFEAFDEPWKQIFYEGSNKWETEWGIFDTDRRMKADISFPTCFK